MKNLLVSSTLFNLQSLQTYHGPPTDTLRDVLEKIEAHEEAGDTNPWDTYGDYEESVSGSFLRQFEREMADLLGKEDAVCMPSGIMAQSITLLIHKGQHGSSSFACHPTCHLLLHEEDAYSELLGMSAVIVNATNHKASALSVPPLLFEDLQRTLEANENVSTLILELPHREIGGQLTPWEEILSMKEYCDTHNIRFHCDGARFFEASLSGYNQTLATTADPFDSIYISLYKGLGGFAGSVLVGTSEFCQQARIWLSRFGGNLHTLSPYMVAGKLGLDRYYHNAGKEGILSFLDLKERLCSIVAALQDDEDVNGIVAFNPKTPESNMIHGYFRESSEHCLEAAEAAEKDTGVRVLHRIRNLQEGDVAYKLGYRSKFEWTLGQKNGAVPLEAIERAWKAFARQLTQK